MDKAHRTQGLLDVHGSDLQLALEQGMSLRMLRAGRRYRQFREDLKQLRAIDLEEKRILMALAEVRAISYK